MRDVQELVLELNLFIPRNTQSYISVRKMVHEGTNNDKGKP
jgi:hypothetical protein